MAEARGVIALGISTIARDSTVLETRYHSLSATEAATAGVRLLSDGEAREAWGDARAPARRHDPIRDVEMVPVRVHVPDLSAAVASPQDLYLRMYLLSSRARAPNQLSLEGIFDHMVNVAWTSLGACLPDRVEEARWRAEVVGTRLAVSGIWLCPPMTDHVVPSGVKIMNAENVRLGAYLAPGTVVVSSGFCNTAAATLGPTVVEGRVSLGVTVGSGTHIGGGASIMGTTSGGGKIAVSIGRNCLIGANGGIGIALGDNCIVEAGCYVTAGAKVRLPDGAIVRAEMLSGQPDLLFRRNSVHGHLEALPSPGWSGLVPALHE
jgi:2,3,4,5-tetrahydropyridine-2,6-dicarboxylate N-succinyltransferase